MYTADVLSGGGARGYCHMPYLMKAEKDSNGIPYCKTRDLLVGTSVGAINSGIMATGKMSAEHLNEIYPDVLNKVFTGKPWWKFPKTPLYDKNKFIEVWDSVIGNGFLLGDCQTKLMITAINTVNDERGCPRNVFFKSWDERDANRRLVDVIVNSFSAPMFFGSTCRPEEGRVYTDGGVGVDNLAIDETMTEASVLGWNSNGNKYLLNAIGCLYSVDPTKQDFKKMCRQNTVQQVLDFFNFSKGGMASAMSLSDQLGKAVYISQHNPNISFRYWDAEIPQPANGMDKLKYLALYKIKGEEMSQSPKISIN